MTTILLQLLGVLYVFVLPGTLAAFHLDTGWSTALRVAVGCMLSLLLVPMASFCAAWLLGTSVTATLVVVLATVANAAGGATLWWRRRAAS